MLEHRLDIGHHVMDRRGLLRVGGAAAMTAAGAALTSSCDDSGHASSPSGSGSGTVSPGVTPPVYVPIELVKPDLPGDKNGTPPAYYHYPEKLKQLYSSPPTKNSKISYLKTGDTGQPPVGNANKFMVELQKRVGATLDITQIIGSDYSAKLATTLAGGDLPDYVQMTYTWPNLVQVLKAEFVDLSPWLAGDGVKKWPNLAAIAPFGWDAVNIGGGLWGIPFTQNSQFGTDCLVRQDIFDQHGISSGTAGVGITQPKDGTEFLDICQELTDVKASKWAISDVLTSAVTFVSQMLGVPNSWELQDGSFVSAYESDRYKDMMDKVNQLWSKGYVYPDASTTLAGGQTLLMSGKAAMVLQSDKNWGQLLSRSDDPKFEPGGVVLPEWHGGGQSAHYLSSGLAAYTSFKKASKTRIVELLDVCNWFAAPFGSEERMFISYGIPQRDYTLNGADPVATPTGIQECFNYRLDYLATLPMGTLISGHPDLTKRLHAYMEALMKKTLPLLSAGLYAPTVLTTGATINKTMTNLRNDIILGRKPVSAWDDGVKAWRSGGGDQIKKEYAQAYAEKQEGKGG